MAKASDSGMGIGLAAYSSESTFTSLSRTPKYQTSKPMKSLNNLGSAKNAATILLSVSDYCATMKSPTKRERNYNGSEEQS